MRELRRHRFRVSALQAVPAFSGMKCCRLTQRARLHALAIPQRRVHIGVKRLALVPCRDG